MHQDDQTASAAGSAHIAGLLVRASSARFDEVLAALRALPGVEVHQQDRAGGRLVVVQETVDRVGQEDGLRRIQALPGVVTAELHYHVVDDVEPC